MTEPRGVLQWDATAAEACTCLSCNQTNSCRYCTSWSREVTTKITRVWLDEVRTHYENHLTITEYHSLNCQQLRWPHDRARRIDLIPTARRCGPPRELNPVSAEEALNLDTSDWAAQTWLYRARTEHRWLLYVGVTGNVAGRMRTHRRSSLWWLECSYLELEVFPDRAMALLEEKIAIQLEQPQFNVVYADRSIR